MIIAPKGNPSSSCWVLVDRPLSGDMDKGYIYSSGTGYVFDKMMHEAGFKDYYVSVMRPDTDDDLSGGDWESHIRHYKPTIIIPIDNAGNWLSREMQESKAKAKKKKNADPLLTSSIQKYAGSLLTCERFDWPHYMVPTLAPQDIIKQWKLRDVVINCDLGKAYAELEYFRLHGKLQEMPKIEAKIKFDSFEQELYIIESMLDAKWVSNDIETIYPKAPTKTQPSQFYKIMPGYPLVAGLATSTEWGISVNMFRDSKSETRKLWQVLAKLFWNVPSVGQNFFNFDANYYEMLGFRLPLDKCRDTMILHHLLWPELQHKLQFLARQYTRHPYWKDEGAGWSIKNMDKMKIYNVKDVCVTLEIFHKEMEEAIERTLV